MNLRRFRSGLLILGLVAALAPSAARGQTPAADAPATRPATRAAFGEFVRFLPDDRGGGELQTAIVTYRDDAGRTVDLIAAVHLADPAYFAELDRRFADYDALLYEQVKPRDGEAGAPAPDAAKPGGLAWIGLVQQAMTAALGLEFQLDAIDYKRPNFVHADLDLETFLARQEARGESVLGLILRAMLIESIRNFAAPPDAPADVPPTLDDLTKAMSDDDPARTLKVILARQLSQTDRLIEAMEGPDGSVLLGERNEHAMAVLGRTLEAGDARRIGVFYGAAHLKGMDRIMTARLGLRRAGEPQWLTAWDLREEARAEE